MCRPSPTDAANDDEMQWMEDGTSALSALEMRPGQPGTQDAVRHNTFLKGKMQRTLLVQKSLWFIGTVMEDAGCPAAWLLPQTVFDFDTVSLWRSFLLISLVPSFYFDIFVTCHDHVNPINHPILSSMWCDAMWCAWPQINEYTVLEKCSACIFALVNCERQCAKP